MNSLKVNIRPSWYASIKVHTVGVGTMKVWLNGAILESLVTSQSLKCLKLSSKKWKLGDDDQISPSGIGRVNNPLKASPEELLVSAAGGIRTIKATGCSIAPDLIFYGTDILSISAKKNIVIRDVLFPAHLGFADAETSMRVVAPNMKKLYGEAGVAGVFIAGADAEGNPTYTGSIKSIGTKQGVGTIVGEARVSLTAKPIKFKPDQGEFVVLTQ